MGERRIKPGKTLQRAGIVFAASIIVGAIIRFFLPVSGPYAMLREMLTVFLGGYLPPIVLAIVTISLFRSTKGWLKEQKRRYRKVQILPLILLILWTAGGVWATRNIALDCIEGTDTMYLGDVKTTFSTGSRRSGGRRYYLSGTGSKGEKMQFQISPGEYERLSNVRRVYVTYYRHIDRVVEIKEEPNITITMPEIDFPEFDSSLQEKLEKIERNLNET